MAPTSSTENARRYDDDERATLLRIAMEALRHGVRHGSSWVPSLEEFPPSLREPRGCFVTLHRGGELRGCVGSLAARGPLVQEVARAAFNAGFRDPRFPPLTEPELADLDVHISVLSEPEPMRFSSESDLLQQLRPGVDGLILREGHHMGTFLPDVWDKLPTPAAFLAQLRRKAGLPAEYWSPSIEVQRYTTEGF
jgi:AmmeMemoRadiSam system protein A